LNRDEKFNPSDHIGQTSIEIVNKAIRVVSSDCPQSIAQTGGIIVCVPNKLTISIEGRRKNKFDAITG